MPQSYSLEELAKSVQDWCRAHRVTPCTGQAAEAISERTIRYYRTIGLMDKPTGHGKDAFGDQHRLQLLGIRLLQAKGLPLRRIRELLYGLSVEDLRELEQRGLEDVESVPDTRIVPTVSEQWTVMPLSDEFMLVSRCGRQLPASLLNKISDLLQAANRTA